MVIRMNQNQIKIMYVLGKKYKFLNIYYNKQFKDNSIYQYVEEESSNSLSNRKFVKQVREEVSRQAHKFITKLPEDRWIETITCYKLYMSQNNINQTIPFCFHTAI